MPVNSGSQSQYGEVLNGIPWRIARSALPYLRWSTGALAVMLAGFLVPGWPVFGWGAFMAAGLALSFAWFFRDPDRARRPAPGLLLSPADGVVQRLHVKGKSRSVEIFMRVWDVHVQRAPCDGKVASVRYCKGGFLPASVRSAGERNVRCETVLATRHGRISILQVAGMIARRVESWLACGQEVAQGERMGIIHLGSQCRVTIPAGGRLLVKIGQRVRAGLTPLAHLAQRKP